MHLYYSFKERFEYRFENRDVEIALMSEKVIPLLQDFDFIVIPQSSSNFLEKILSPVNKPVVKAHKSSMAQVLAFVDTLPLQKKEKLSHLERLAEMGDSLKINGFKASQRVKYEEILFQKPSLPAGNGVILDDSCFSGTTMRALKNIAPHCEYLAIFAK